MLPLVGVFGQASGVASYPFLSRLAVENKINEMNQLLNAIIRKIGVYLIPISAVMMILSEQIIAVLFQHGRFTAEQTHSTAPVLVLYLAGSFFFAASTIVMRNYYAKQNTALPMIICTIIALLSLPGYYVFSKILGARGIALAASIAMFAQFTFLYGIWSARQGNMQGLIKTTVIVTKVAGISAVGALLCFGIKMFLVRHGLPGVNRIQDILITAIAGIPAIVFIFSALEAARIADSRELLKRLAGAK
jgi:putative peptidoglycan lipid II flippase